MDVKTRQLVDVRRKRIFQQVCAHWAKFSLIEVRDIAALMQGENPEALQDVVINDYGDGVDLSSEIAMLMSAVSVGDLAVSPAGIASPNDRTEVVVTTLIPWLHVRGYSVLADGLTLSPLGTTKTTRVTGAGASVSGDGEIPDDLPVSSKNVFPLTKSAMIARHKHEWPDVKADIKGASENGLSACKAGARKWHEAYALDWAYSNHKLIMPSMTATLTNAFRVLPSQIDSIDD